MSCCTSTTNKVQKKRRSFTIQEDCLLAQAVQKFGEKSWDKVSACLPNRNARQCKERWMSYLSPNLINGPWSKEEDELLYNLCNTYGKHWTCLTKFFHGRSDNNLKNRWYSVISKRKTGLVDYPTCNTTSQPQQYISNEKEPSIASQNTNYFPEFETFNKFDINSLDIFGEPEVYYDIVF